MKNLESTEIALELPSTNSDQTDLLFFQHLAIEAIIRDLAEIKLAIDALENP